MSERNRALLLGLGAIVVIVVVVAIVVLTTGDDDGTATPSADASEVAAEPSVADSESAAAGSPSAEAEPSSLSEEETLAILEEIEDQVEAIRGLPEADIGPPDLITRAQLRDELIELFDEDYPPEERENDTIALRALGLLEEGQDVAELQLELLGDQVLGFYDDTDTRMVVVTDVGLDALGKVTYAHEYTHALQYAHLGVAELDEMVEDHDDRIGALAALVEGDANVTMIAWLIQHLSQEEQLDLTQIPVPPTPEVPAWMIAQLDFPYSAGQQFVGQLAGGDPFAPDFTDVDAAYTAPPASTEQVIDFNAWLTGEQPVAVQLPDLAAELGEGWREVDDTPIGEASIGIALEYLGATPAAAGLAADGWGGDHFIVASGPDDAFALAWLLAWDEQVDSGQFLDAYETVIPNLEFPASVRALPDGRVLVIHASSQDVHDTTLGIVAP